MFAKYARKLNKASADEIEMILSVLSHILDKIDLSTHGAYKFALFIREEEKEEVS